jgi:hypothetical protein
VSALYQLGPQLLPLAMVLIAALIASRIPPDRLAWLSTTGSHRAAPWIVGGITALVGWIIWGSLAPIATIHDETAYLLQAKLLAVGRLTGPGRPLPEFFEQFHVFVTPQLAAKYPLGFALALVPGIWLGAPALMPLLLNGIAGGLLFALSRRLTTPAVATLAWLLWLLAPGTITYHTAYLSETLSGPLWLAGCWALLEWWRSASTKWLMLLAAAVALCAVTRPLTAVGLAIPCGLAVLIRTAQSRRWSALVLPAITAAILVLPLFYQNSRVTGDWRLTPWEHYADIYAPVDRPGFTIDGRPPQRELPKDMRTYVVYFTEAHVGFTPDHLPRIFLARLGQVLHDAWGQWLIPLGVFALVGLVAAGGEIWFGVGTLLSLMAVHLVFAHPLNWSLYYQEGAPALAIVTALGIHRVLEFLVERTAKSEQDQGRATSVLAVWLVILAAGITGVTIVSNAREKKFKDSGYHQAFHDLVSTLPGKTIVFVRYSPIHRFYTSLVDNPPDLESAPSWIVHDLETENARLIQIAPDRTPYLYIEQKKLMVPLDRDGTPATTRASGQ